GNGNSYWGLGISGYQTPASSVPVSGTANYVAGGPASATGAVRGIALIPSDTSLLSDLRGSASINVNFSTAAVTGSLNNMEAEVEGDTPWMPWNNVALTGNLSGATVKGATAVTSSPS